MKGYKDADRQRKRLWKVKTDPEIWAIKKEVGNAEMQKRYKVPEGRGGEEGARRGRQCKYAHMFFVIMIPLRRSDGQ